MSDSHLQFIGLLAEIEREVAKARSGIQDGWDWAAPYRHLAHAQAMMRQALPTAAAYAVAWGEPVKIAGV